MILRKIIEIKENIVDYSMKSGKIIHDLNEKFNRLKRTSLKISKQNFKLKNLISKLKKKVRVSNRLE